MIRPAPRPPLFPYTTLFRSLGTQVTVAQIGSLGPVPFIALLMVMAASMGAALLVARAMNASTAVGILAGGATAICGASRSEEHTSELQSRLHLVCRLLLEKK